MGPAAPGGDATAVVRRVEANGSRTGATSLVRGGACGGWRGGDGAGAGRWRCGGWGGGDVAGAGRAGCGRWEGATALVRGRPAAGDGEATAHVRPAPEPPGPEAPGGDAAPPEVVARARRRRARRRLAGAALVVLALAAAGALVSLLTGSGPSTSSTAPLSADDVRGAAQDFAAAYGDEDPTALRAVLARDVRRVTPDGVQQGRTAVTAVYRRQFAADDVRGYALSDLSVRPGEAGRAAGRYTVDRAGAPDVTGRIVFGVVREAGRPRIALLAATPDA